MPTNRYALLLFIGALLLTAAGHPSPLHGQSEDGNRIRLGINFGGTALVGVTAEYLRGDEGFEATLGTIGFNDISLSLAAKHYLASGKLRPAIGVGFWGIAARTEVGSGGVFLLKVPIAVEWRITEADATGLEVGFNRALWVNRVDPDDNAPVRSNLIPFPALYYRRGWER